MGVKALLGNVERTPLDFLDDGRVLEWEATANGAIATKMVARRPGFGRDEKKVLAVDVAHTDRVTPPPDKHASCRPIQSGISPASTSTSRKSSSTVWRPASIRCRQASYRCSGSAFR